MAIQGAANQDGDSIVYAPEPTPAGSPEPSAVIASDAEFEEGTVKFRLHATVPGAPNGAGPPALPGAGLGRTDEPSCRVELSMRDRPIQVGINVVPGNLYGISVFNGSQWETLAASGAGHELPLGVSLALEVRVTGSLIELLANGVLVCSTYAAVRRSPIRIRFVGSVPLTVSDLKIVTQKPKLFVVMQFTDEFNDLYREVIKPTCEKWGFDVIRADDMYTSGLIISDILTSIQEASVVVADVTPDNPNVYYEVGYAHGVRKPLILLSDKKRETKLPFDVAGVRTIFYDNTIGGKGQVESRLDKHLQSIVGRQVVAVP